MDRKETGRVLLLGVAPVFGAWALTEGLGGLGCTPYRPEWQGLLFFPTVLLCVVVFWYGLGICHKRRPRTRVLAGVSLGIGLALGVLVLPHYMVNFLFSDRPDWPTTRKSITVYLVLVAPMAVAVSTALMVLAPRLLRTRRTIPVLSIGLIAVAVLLVLATHLVLGTFIGCSAIASCKGLYARLDVNEQGSCVVSWNGSHYIVWEQGRELLSGTFGQAASLADMSCSKWPTLLAATTEQIPDNAYRFTLLTVEAQTSQAVTNLQVPSLRGACPRSAISPAEARLALDGALVIDADGVFRGAEQTRDVRPSSLRLGAWAPDGGSVFYFSPGAILQMNLRERSLHVTVSWPLRYAPHPESEAALEPASSELAYIDRTGEAIVTINLDTGESTRHPLLGLAIPTDGFLPNPATTLAWVGPGRLLYARRLGAGICLLDVRKSSPRVSLLTSYQQPVVDFAVDSSGHLYWIARNARANKSYLMKKAIGR